MLKDCTKIEDYLNAYGSLLGVQAQRAMNPLHVPGRDEPADPGFLRQLHPAQGHYVAALAKNLKRMKFSGQCAECGAGKTVMSQGIVHVHAEGNPYRAIVFCPPTLPPKWEREILETIPNARVIQLESLDQLIGLAPKSKPTQPEWWIIKETSAKEGPDWSPAYISRKTQGEACCCPQCGEPVRDSKGLLIPPTVLARRKHWCNAQVRPERMTKEQSDAADKGDQPVCGAAIWSHRRKNQHLLRAANDGTKWAIARYIHDHLRYFFDYMVVDEIHEENSTTSARAAAFGTLCASVRKIIGATGTLFAGYAWHVRTMLMRVAPASLVQEGHTWSGVTRFNEMYGRLETKVTDSESDTGRDNRRSKGRQQSTRTSVKPGIVPTLFARHLLKCFAFLGLDELADNLPGFDEYVVPIDMDAEQAKEYNRVEDKLRTTVKDMLRMKDKRLLSAMLNCLLTYPDLPYDWQKVGYWDKDENGNRLSFVPVVKPKSLDRSIVRPKERALLDQIHKEKAERRQCWVFVDRTEEYDVPSRLQEIMEAEGLIVKVLRASKVPTKTREAWINKNAPGVDVIISHPKPVRTGLDLFDKGGRHNFASILFYETGYDLYTLRQAARRAWRMAQWLDCRVFYFFYAGTMQDRAMTLMGRKLSESEALEGKFSAEGLAAMGAEEDSMQMALAKSLINQLDDVGADRAWSKVQQKFDRGSVGLAPEIASAAPAATVTKPRISPVQSPVAWAKQVMLFEIN